MSRVNYINVQFKGSNYMVVEGSKRANVLKRANRAWSMGYDDLAIELFNEALDADGCAFTHRERQESEDAKYSDLQSYYNLYN